ncbi:MAG: hypothetical protein B6U75_03350 [Desulfurococcales archaeon ex4484_217_1]|nr:MAG: hypothetical protein B6U75_03350 [Desulfurococcales archaeon ex4484_217_1]
MAERIPPELQTRIAQLQQLQEQLILVKTSKEDLMKELTEKKEILELRKRTLEKQESFLQKQFEDLRKKVTEELMKTYRRT